MSWTAIIGFLLTHQLDFVLSQRGEFYEPVEEGKQPEVLMSNLGLDRNIVRSKVVNVTRDINFFGNTTKTLKVYFDGVIGFDKGDTMGACGSANTANKHIAIYWLPNTNGEVTFLEADTKQLDKDKERLTTEINNALKALKAFDEIIQDSNQIDHVCYITWNLMSNSQNFRPQKNFNSFQAVLVTINRNGERTSYVIFIYRILSYSYFHTLNGQDQQCRNAAIIYLFSGESGERNERFLLSAFFPFRRDWPILFSNQEDFQSLGRYTFRLKKPATTQAKPPYINCAGKNPDPFCLGANWFHVMAKIQQDFCLYREPGLYPYPLSCKQLVHCSVGKNATVSTCPNGINFNPIISNCDYEQNIECKIPPNVTINTTHTNQPGFTTPTPQKILHNNTCILLRNGLIIDPFSCAHYLSCSNSQTIRRKCQEGLLFNAKSLRCDYPENVNCSRSTPSNTITTPLNKCKYLLDGLTKDPLSCAHFSSCSGGNSYRFKCPAGLLFNSASLVCDYATNVNC